MVTQTGFSRNIQQTMGLTKSGKTLSLTAQGGKWVDYGSDNIFEEIFLIRLFYCHLISDALKESSIKKKFSFILNSLKTRQGKPR